MKSASLSASAQTSRPPRKRFWYFLGPAFVAAIAYVDPGNVAANLTAGADYGYLLIWVLVVANLMAVIIQYLSAKLGFAAGKSLPQVIGERTKKPVRLLFWLQAEIVAAATDLAEVIGGALALYLLFDIPLLLGGVITGVVSMVLLSIHSRVGQRSFEFVVTGLLLILTIGFCVGLVINPAPPTEIIGGLVPRFQGTETVLLAASMLGATVMPHAIYLHSSLTRDRFGKVEKNAATFVKMTRVDVVLGLFVAGSVNIAMLLLAAVNLQGVTGTDSIIGAQHAVQDALGPVIGTLFSVGLLASGLASTSVGCYAGSEIMDGLLKIRIPLALRRLITLIPALIVLMLPVSPTDALVISQAILSFGIPFALVPLVRYTGMKSVMGSLVVSRYTTGIAWFFAAIIIVLNITLLILLFSGL